MGNAITQYSGSNRIPYMRDYENQIYRPKVWFIAQEKKAVERYRNLIVQSLLKRVKRPSAGRGPACLRDSTGEQAAKPTYARAEQSKALDVLYELGRNWNSKRIEGERSSENEQPFSLHPGDGGRHRSPQHTLLSSHQHRSIWTGLELPQDHAGLEHREWAQLCLRLPVGTHSY